MRGMGGARVKSTHEGVGGRLRPVVAVVVVGVATIEEHVFDIDPCDPSNIFAIFTPEPDQAFTQAAPQSVCLKDLASWNIWCMSLTADTSHFDRSWLNFSAYINMPHVPVTRDTCHFDRSWLKDFACANM